MPSDHAWGAASGPHSRAVHLILYRFPSGESFDPATSQSWIIENEDGTLNARLEKRGWYTGVWRSESGRVYVTDAGGFIQTSTAAPDKWDVYTTTGMLVGIWGLDDSHVYAWGLRGKTDFMLAFNGNTWTEMPAPQGGIVDLHGTGPNALLAVGDAGLIASWDGSSWSTESCPNREPLRAALLNDDGNAWACGNNGALLKRTAAVWTEVLRHDKPLGGVAQFNGDLWVGAYGDFGLCKLVDSKLESIKPNIKGVKLQVRGDTLLFCGSAVLGQTLDGAGFTGYGVKGAAEMLASQPPPWD